MKKYGKLVVKRIHFKM